MTPGVRQAGGRNEVYKLIVVGLKEEEWPENREPFKQLWVAAYKTRKLVELLSLPF